MGSSKRNDDLDLNYIKRIVDQVFGDEVWNGFYDVVTSEKPRIDMYDSTNSLIVLAQIYGIQSPEDVSITISSNMLNIKGIQKDKYQKNRPGKVLKSECLYGSFDRTVELPYTVDEKTIKAVYENGILEIVMEKSTSSEGKTIEVEFKK